MKKTINFYDFEDAFKKYDRDINFSYDGKRALFDYLEELEKGSEEEMELDVIGLCCDFSEYKSAYEAMEQYQPEDMPVEGEPGDDLIEIQEKNEEAALEWLNDRTMVIEVEGGGVIIQNF
jgi:hypothetical protein